MLEDLTRDVLAENMNTTFRAQHEMLGTFNWDLIAVSELKSSPRQQAFSILFRGPLDPIFGQGLYRLEHDRLGAFDLFIVPIGREPDGMRYEAVFNRLVK